MLRLYTTESIKHAKTTPASGIPRVHRLSSPDHLEIAVLFGVQQKKKIEGHFRSVVNRVDTPTEEGG